MANAGFTRDEAILALDVLYFHGDESLNSKSPIIIELSELLNGLPIHKKESRNKIFRTPSGVLKQILSFRSSYQKGKKDTNVGKIFYEVANEYSDRLDELHDIANAIKSNINCYDDVMFGNMWENDSFPEGALLGHLHRIIEKRDSAKLEKETRCTICKINTADIYFRCPDLMSMHLTVPITELDGKKKYSERDYITVCPNCHAALHQSRPWLSIKNVDELLK